MRTSTLITKLTAGTTGAILLAASLFSQSVLAEDVQFGWREENGATYWYENGIRQGTEGRGKEVYDPGSDAWYWLDAVQGGAKAVSKDVYQESNGGKWVRYDEKGHMIKGWQETEAGTYYFDTITGAMYKGNHTIDGVNYFFDEATGILGQAYVDGWNNINGVDYWYENGVRQGYDPGNPAYRGKEIYDPSSDAWYWLDNVQQGAKAVSKDVYQESYSAYPDRPDGTGKWVRYDENGRMIKGWQETEAGTYYFEEVTGSMAKGDVVIDGVLYHFDVFTGILEKDDVTVPEPGDETAFKELTVVDNSECTIRITGINKDDRWDYVLNAYFENKSQNKTYMFAVKDAAVNGVQFDPYFATSVAPGKMANKKIGFSKSKLEEYGIDDPTDIEMWFRVYDSNDWMAEDVAQEIVHVYPYGKNKVTVYQRQPQSKDNVIVDNEYVTVIVTGYEDDKIYGYTANLFLVNKTDKELMFGLEDVSVNGYMADPYWAQSVIPGKCAFSSMSWSKSTFDSNGITNVQDIQFTIRVYDNNDWMGGNLVEETVMLRP